MLHVGNPIFFPTLLPFSTLPTIAQFLFNNLFALSRWPFSKKLLTKVDDAILLLYFKGSGLIILYPHFFSYFISCATSPSLLLPNLKLLLTNINFGFNFLKIIFSIKSIDFVFEKLKSNFLFIINWTPSCFNKFFFCSKFEFLKFLIFY